MSAHRYWRIYATTTWAANPTIGSVNMRETVGGPNRSVTGNGTASASSFLAGNEPAKAFMGDETAPITNFWYTNTESAPVWLKWDFGSGVAYDIGVLDLWSGTSSSGGTIKNFSLQWSDDNTSWTTALTGATDGSWSDNHYSTYLVPGVGIAAITPPSPLTFIYGGGTANISPLLASVSIYGGAVSTLTAPSASVSIYGGAIAPALTAPHPTLTSTSHNSYGEQAAFLTAPIPLLTITTGTNARVTAPSPTLSATGTATNLATATLTSPTPTLASTGKVSGMATATLTAPSPNLIGYGGAVCSVTLTGSPTLQATGTTGGVVSAALSCPLFELTASATAQNYGSADLLAPSPRMGQTAQAWLIAPSARLTAIGSAVITATYEAYAVNLKHSDPNANDEITRYTNFPFTHVVRYQNSYYGANSTGLYLLEGTTDNGSPIPWAFETAITDFKTPNKKTLAAAYFSGRLGPASTISLIEGEHTPSVYSFTTPRGTLAQNHRQKFGKGTKGRYYALSASGTGTCELDGIEPEVHQLTRRI